ncbi:MAG: FecR domain-containing protein [Nitrospinales bacterium]
MKIFPQKPKIITLQILSFVIFSSLFISVQSVHAQKVATLEGVKGDVRVVLPGKSRALKGRNGMALYGKTVIKTPTKHSYAIVVYNKGTKIRIMPLSELVLASSEPSDKGFIRIKIDLIVGKIFCLVDKLTEDDYFEVKTPTSTSGIKGTFFSVQTTDKISKWVVKEGNVDITNRGCVEKTVKVGEPKTTIVRICEGPTEPKDMTPEEQLEFDEAEKALNGETDDFDTPDTPDDPGELTDDEIDAIDEAAEAARQLPLNVTSPKF